MSREKWEEWVALCKREKWEEWVALCKKEGCFGTPTGDLYGALLWADSRIKELEEVEKRFHAHDCASAINEVKAENARLREYLKRYGRKEAEGTEMNWRKGWEELVERGTKDVGMLYSDKMDHVIASAADYINSLEKENAKWKGLLHDYKDQEKHIAELEEENARLREAVEWVYGKLMRATVISGTRHFVDYCGEVKDELRRKVGMEEG